jgi:nicotinate-nucleotide adenylyltransferase
VADAGVLGFAHRTLPLPPHDISATGIRERVAAGLPIDSMVPPAVARYIELNHLYKD